MPQDFDLIKEEIKEISETSKLPDNDIYLFVSFDLMDSTKLKNNNKNWIDIIKSFYAIVKASISNNMDKFRVWKYIGDEVVFIRQLQGYKEIKTFLDDVYDTQQEVSETLSKKYTQILKVKATTWIADVLNETGVNNDSDKIKNIMFTTEEHLMDFIGQDIDIGFRIAKYSYPKVVTVSAKLAYFLYSSKIVKPTKQNFIIASYQELKGVWDNKLYPIIWYTKELEDLKNKKMPYDDYIKKDELKNIVLDITDPIDYLNAILENNNLLEELKEFPNTCDKEIKNDNDEQAFVILPEKTINN